MFISLSYIYTNK